MMRLECERVVLRGWQEGDVDDLVEGLNDLEVARWLAFVPHPYTRADVEGWVRFCLEREKAGREDAYQFAIELKSERKVIGGVTLDRISRVHETAGGGAPKTNTVQWVRIAALPARQARSVSCFVPLGLQHDGLTRGTRGPGMGVRHLAKGFASPSRI